MSDHIERALGRIEGKLDSVGQEQTVIHVKLDRHLQTPHADPKELQSLQRWKWMVLGGAALLSAGVSLAAVLL
jgi:hypothetical protein